MLRRRADYEAFLGEEFGGYVAGMACPGTWGDDRVTLLLPPGEKRTLIVNGGAGEAVMIAGRSGISLTVGDA